MFAIPLLLFKSIFGGMIKEVLSLWSKYPMVFIGLLVMGLLVWQTYGFAERKTTAKYTERIKQYDAAQKALNIKIVATEKSSEEAALVAKGEIEGKDTEIEKISGSYEARLLKERASKGTEIVRVSPPTGKDGEPKEAVDVVFEGGQVVCRRLPTVFVDTVNELIDAANKKVGTTK